MQTGSPLSTHIFFFNDTATTEIYTLSLHDALPICAACEGSLKRLRVEQIDVYQFHRPDPKVPIEESIGETGRHRFVRSEEHTSELQSLAYLVCRLLLEKKKNKVRVGDVVRY